MRELVDLEQLDIGDVHATVLDGGRRGKLRTTPPKPVIAPRRNNEVSRPAGRAAGNVGYSPIEKEDAGYVVMCAYMAAELGLDLEDVRNQANVGADAVDHTKDVWVEMKAHGAGRPSSVSLQPSEAKRAQEKGESYWLAVVSGLEKPHVPALLLVSNPLAKLDVDLRRGITLMGLDEMERREEIRRKAQRERN